MTVTLRGDRSPWAFWKHVAAAVLIGAAVVRLLDGSGVGWVLIGVVPLAYLGVARSTGRSVWAVAGAVGLLLVTTYFADEGDAVIGLVPALPIEAEDSGLELWQTALIYTGLGVVYVLLGRLLPPADTARPQAGLAKSGHYRMAPMRVGVLAVQGNFREHAAMLRALGAGVVEVRLPEQLEGLDGLVIPGGESTAITRLMRLYGLEEAIRQFAAPVLGTCAGMILLDRAHLGLVDVDVERNGYGRQLASFEDRRRPRRRRRADAGCLHPRTARDGRRRRRRGACEP